MMWELKSARGMGEWVPLGGKVRTSGGTGKKLWTKGKWEIFGGGMVSERSGIWVCGKRTQFLEKIPKKKPKILGKMGLKSF